MVEISGSRDRRSFYYEDQDGYVIKYANGKLSVWIGYPLPKEYLASPELAAQFVSWAIVNGVTSAVVYWESGELENLGLQKGG